MEFRKATADDAELFMKLRLEMLCKVNKLPDDYSFTDELVENSRRYFLEGDQTTCIAVDDGKAIACASISYIYVMPTFSHPAGKRAHIMNVYTNEKYRRQGIARKLVAMLIGEARNRGVTEIALDSTESGRPLYEALGFRASEEYMAMNTKN